jgi:type IV secretory pathway TraG/TraD family ATPase VirD4
MTPDEVRRMHSDEVLIFTRGQPAIRAQQLKYYDHEFFRDRAAIAPPATSDRLITARPSADGREKGQGARAAADGRVAPVARAIETGTDAAGSNAGLGVLRFLKYGAGKEGE